MEVSSYTGEQGCEIAPKWKSQAQKLRSRWKITVNLIKIRAESEKSRIVRLSWLSRKLWPGPKRRADKKIYSLYLFYPDSPKVWTQVESVCCSSVTSPLHMGRVCAAVLRKKSPGFQLANELTDFYFTFSYIFVSSLQKQKVPEL